MSEQLYGPLADKWADKYEIPRHVFRSLIRNESRWNPNAVGSAGEVGLTQLKQAAALEVGVTAADRSDPNESLRGGAKYLGRLLERCRGNLLCALGSYNQGFEGFRADYGHLAGRQYAERILGQGHYTTFDPDTAKWGVRSITSESGETKIIECDFSWFSPSTWVCEFQRSMRGGLLAIITVGLVIYAAAAALRTGG